jgi:hypothetical protein
MLMDFVVEPITHSVKQQLRNQFIQELRQGQLQARHWQYLNSEIRFSPFFAGFIFEVIAQLRV